MKECCMGGVTEKSDLYKYRCFSCSKKFESLDAKDRHSMSCTGSGFVEENIRFNVIIGPKFKNTSFEYFIVPRDPFINYLTNLSLWKMVSNTLPIIEHYQLKRRLYPSLKINAALVSDFFPSQDINVRRKDAIRVKRTQIFLQSPNAHECYPTTNINNDVLGPMFRDLVLACDNFEHRGSGWRIKTSFV